MWTPLLKSESPPTSGVCDTNRGVRLFQKRIRDTKCSENVQFLRLVFSTKHLHWPNQSTHKAYFLECYHNTQSICRLDAIVYGPSTPIHPLEWCIADDQQYAHSTCSVDFSSEKASQKEAARR